MPARQALVMDTVPIPAVPCALALNALAARLAAAIGRGVGILITRIVCRQLLFCHRRHLWRNGRAGDDH